MKARVLTSHNRCSWNAAGEAASRVLQSDVTAAVGLPTVSTSLSTSRVYAWLLCQAHCGTSGHAVSPSSQRGPSVTLASLATCPLACAVPLLLRRKAPRMNREMFVIDRVEPRRGESLIPAFLSVGVALTVGAAVAFLPEAVVAAFFVSMTMCAVLLLARHYVNQVPSATALVLPDSQSRGPQCDQGAREDTRSSTLPLLRGDAHSWPGHIQALSGVHCVGLAVSRRAVRDARWTCRWSKQGPVPHTDVDHPRHDSLCHVRHAVVC